MLYTNGLTQHSQLDGAHLCLIAIKQWCVCQRVVSIWMVVHILRLASALYYHAYTHTQAQVVHTFAPYNTRYNWSFPAHKKFETAWMFRSYVVQFQRRASGLPTLCPFCAPSKFNSTNQSNTRELRCKLCAVYVWHPSHGFVGSLVCTMNGGEVWR